jgi:hypothetical protein
MNGNSIKAITQFAARYLPIVIQRTFVSGMCATLSDEFWKIFDGEKNV